MTNPISNLRIIFALLSLLTFSRAFSRQEPAYVAAFPTHQNKLRLVSDQLKTDATQADSSSKWTELYDAKGAFKINLPVEPESAIREIPIPDSEYKQRLKMYISIDTVRAKNYIIRYNDQPEGLYMTDKRVFFEAISNDVKGKGEIITEPSVIWKEGSEGREIKVKLSDGYFCTMQVFLRGNRLYLLMRQNMVPNQPDDQPDDFFRSFTFLPTLTPAFINWQPQGENINATLVSEPKRLTTDEVAAANDSYVGEPVSYACTNPMSGATYTFEYTRLRPYYRVDHLDSLYKNLTDNIKEYEDSIIKSDPVSVSDMPGRELLINNKAKGTWQRLRMVLHNDRVFFMTAYADSAGLFDHAGNTFFNSLRISGEGTNHDIYASKSGKIFSDLRSTDSLVFQAARGALSYYNFKADELPLIYAALQHSYPDDMQNIMSARIRLIEILEKLKDRETVHVLKKLYDTTKGKDHIKATVLVYIAAYDKDDGFAWYMDKLINDAPLNANSYLLFSALQDSMPSVSANWKQISPLVKYGAYRWNILYMANKLAEQKTDESLRILAESADILFTHAKTDLDSLLSFPEEDEHDYGSKVYQYLQLLSKLKNPPLADYISKTYLSKRPDGMYAVDAVESRLQYALDNDQSIVNRLMDSLGTRYQLMSAYHTSGLLDKVPAKYKAQPEFARLLMYQSLMDYEEAPESVQLLGNMQDGNNIYYVFSYRYDDAEEYIGISGPNEAGNKKLDFENNRSYTDGEYLKEDWKTQAKELIERSKKGR